MSKKLVKSMITVLFALLLVACGSDKTIEETSVVKETPIVEATPMAEEIIPEPEYIDVSKLPAIPDDFIERINESIADHDELIARGKDYIENPETFTAAALEEFNESYKEVLGKYAETFNEINLKYNTEDGPHSEEWAVFKSKALDLTHTIAGLPSAQ